jgi:polyisoprenoid-binding protein YceI
MSKADRFHFDKFTQDLQMLTTPKRGGVPPSRLAGGEVYSVKAKKTGGNKRDWRRVLTRGALMSFGESQMEYFARRERVTGLDTLNKRVKKSTALILLASLVHLAGPAYAASEKHSIDSVHSKVTMHVYKTGLFSGLAHDHEIEAPIEWGEINDSESPSVEVRVNSNKLRVLDPEASEGTRAKIQSTMQGAEVLDVGRFPQIHFQSTAVEPSGTDHWVVHGNLDLHGQTHQVSVDVTLKDGLYGGTAVLKQTQFGITPVRIAGGTVKVKDEVKLEFSVAIVK